MPKKTVAAQKVSSARSHSSLPHLPNLPSVTISPRGIARLRAGHPWVYRSDIASAEGIPAGAMVRVADHRGKPLGTALYSSSSQIAIRMISRDEVGDLPSLVAARIRAAIAYRRQVVADSDAYRVVFSEADFLPGLIVDRYNDVVSVQVLTQAMDAEPVRGALVATLVEELKPAGIVERVDPRIRELEQLPARESGMLWGKKSATVINMNGGSMNGGTAATSAAKAGIKGTTPIAALKRSATQNPFGEREDGRGRPSLHGMSDEMGDGITDGVAPENVASENNDKQAGVRFYYDALAGQKTGAFLDQRENYAAASRYAHGNALDVFCYQGGFALHLARQCASVAGVDSSRPALEVAEKNAALNFPEREIEWTEANAFDLLRDYAAAGRRYETVVIDPPAFAKTRRDLPKAMSGYKELNLRALKMLVPGGILVTCSCSFHVSAAEFVDVVGAAAIDAHKSLRVIEKRGAAKDHPMLLNVPETGYLKCLVLSVGN